MQDLAVCAKRGKPCSITHERLPFSKPSIAVLICVVWDTVHMPRQWTNLLTPIILMLGKKNPLWHLWIHFLWMKRGVAAWCGRHAGELEVLVDFRHFLSFLNTFSSIFWRSAAAEYLLSSFHLFYCFWNWNSFCCLSGFLNDSGPSRFGASDC